MCAFAEKKTIRCDLFSTFMFIYGFHFFPPFITFIHFGKRLQFSLWRRSLHCYDIFSFHWIMFSESRILLKWIFYGGFFFVLGHLLWSAFVECNLCILIIILTTSLTIEAINMRFVAVDQRFDWEKKPNSVQFQSMDKYFINCVRNNVFFESILQCNFYRSTLYFIHAIR